jgi:hypothetical protein
MSDHADDCHFYRSLDPKVRGWKVVFYLLYVAFFILGLSFIEAGHALAAKGMFSCLLAELILQLWIWRRSMILVRYELGQEKIVVIRKDRRRRVKREPIDLTDLIGTQVISNRLHVVLAQMPSR